LVHCCKPRGLLVFMGLLELMVYIGSPSNPCLMQLTVGRHGCDETVIRLISLIRQRHVVSTYFKVDKNVVLTSDGGNRQGKRHGK
jgi:hypothetical protein